MRLYGAPLMVDLLSGGAPSVAVTPGTGVAPVVFTTGQQKQVVDKDNWPICAGIGIAIRIGFDQAAAGGSVVNWDETFRAIDSIDLSVPLFGTTHRKEVHTGPVAKHIGEFVANGYRYCDHARTQLVSTDGDVALDLYLFVPFANECAVRSDDFMPWTGWLNALSLTVNIATASTIAAVSTGAVTETPCTVRAWLETFPSLEPKIPMMSQLNRYVQAAAAGSTTVLLLNVGQSFGLTGVLVGSRIAALFELMNKLGFGGASTADLFTAFQCSDLGQDVVNSPDSFVLSFLRQIGHRGPISGNGASPIHDGAGNPYTMAATPNNLLNDSNLAYMPWRFSSPDQPRETLVKYSGNLAVTRFFSAVPTTGSHIFVTNEWRQFDSSQTRMLLDEARISPLVRAKMPLGGDFPRDIRALRIPTRA